MAFPDAAIEVLDRPLVAHISTISPAGKPQTSVVWFERRDEEIVIFSGATAPKVRNLRNNPNIDIVVIDPDHEAGAGTPYYVRLSGTAEIREYEDGLRDRLAIRYGHPNGYPPEYGSSAELVNIHVTVQRVSGFGPFKRQSWAPAP